MLMPTSRCQTVLPFQKKDISAFKIHTEHSVKELKTLKHIQSPASVSGPEGDSPESSYKTQNKQKAHVYKEPTPLLKAEVDGHVQR